MNKPPKTIYLMHPELPDTPAEAAQLDHWLENGRAKGLRLRIDRGMVEAEQVGRIWYVDRASLMKMPCHDLRGKHPRAATQFVSPNNSDEIRARIERGEAACKQRLAIVSARFPDMSRVGRGEIREWILKELMR